MSDLSETQQSDLDRGFTLEPGRIEVQWSWRYAAPLTDAENDVLRAAAKIQGQEVCDFLHDAGMQAAREVVEAEFGVTIE